MAEKIGVRELKNQVSSILRHVCEEAAEYVITHHGQPIAILRPIRADILVVGPDGVISQHEESVPLT